MACVAHRKYTAELQITLHKKSQTLQAKSWPQQCGMCRPLQSPQETSCGFSYTRSQDDGGCAGA